MRMARQFVIVLQRELESLFLSPISYAVLTIGWFLNGYAFYATLLGSGGNVGESVRGFFGGNALFWLVMVFLPPLFTMRLFAEEKRSGTLEMLLTAPVGEWEVVGAKFFAGLLFYAALWFPSVVYLGIVKFYGAPPPASQIATSFAGMALIGGLFTAVGLFASSLTRSQILAAVLATVFNLLLFLVPSLAQFIPNAEVERLMTELSIQAHFIETFSKGLLDTAHVVFYVVLMAVFLFWTTRVLESQRWR